MKIGADTYGNAIKMEEMFAHAISKKVNEKRQGNPVNEGKRQDFYNNTKKIYGQGMPIPKEKVIW